MKVKLHIVDAAETMVLPGGEKLVEPAISVLRKKKPKFHLGGRISSTYPFPLWSTVTKNARYFPTGLVPHVIKYLKEKKIEVEMIHYDSDKVAIEYNSVVKFPTAKPHLKGVEFRPDQTKLLNYVAEAQRGVILSATGTGKTLLQFGIVNMFVGARVLLLAHLEGIVSQTYEDAVNIYGFPSVQMVEGTKDVLTADFVISTIQSFHKMAHLYTDYFDVVIIDEVHHVNSLTGMYGKTMRSLLAPARLGFTATPPKTLEGTLVMTGYVGPVIGEFTIEDAVEEGILATPKIKLIKLPNNQKIGDLRTYADVYQEGVVENNTRNRKVVSLIQEYSKENKACLVFVNKIMHGELIRKLAWKFHLKVEFVQGETPKDLRMELKEKLKDKRLNAIISTAVWKEGVNVPSLDVVINAGGGKSEIQTLQIIGRGLRKTDEKSEVLIVDFFDPSHRYLVDHFGHRLCLYFDNNWLALAFLTLTSLLISATL